jgi:AraC-like DNA-binding protein
MKEDKTSSRHRRRLGVKSRTENFMKPQELVCTQKLRPSERSSAWQRAMLQGLGVLSIAKDARCLEASIEKVQLSDIGIYRLTANGYEVERPVALAERDNPPRAKIALQLRGASEFRQNGHSAVLHAGEWTVYDNSRPYYVTNPNDIQLLILVVPKERISRACFKLDEILLRTFSGSSGVASLGFQFVAAMFDESVSIDRYCSSDLADIGMHLISLSFLEFLGHALHHNLPAMEILRDRIKVHVLQNLRNPGLDVSEVADSLRCSTRYVHKAFEAEGVSLSEYMWRERLLRCRADLSSCDDKRSITEIAFAWGFNSSAHFSTKFRACFGQSPIQFRSRHSSALPRTAIS